MANRDHTIKLRVDQEWLDALDALTNNRSEFIRAAVCAAVQAERVRRERARLDAALDRMKKTGMFWVEDNGKDNTR